MTVPCPGARTKRQGQRETIAAGGESLAGTTRHVILSTVPAGSFGDLLLDDTLP
jgi:hypothetical protein